MKISSKKREYLRFPLFYGIFFVFICGYGSSLFADSANVIVPSSAVDTSATNGKNKFIEKRVISGMLPQYAATIFQSIPQNQIQTTTVYSPTDLTANSCPTNTTKVGTNPPVNYRRELWYYASHVTYYCSNSDCSTDTKCTNYAYQKTADAAQITQPQTTEPGTVCKATQSAPQCTAADTHCPCYLCADQYGNPRVDRGTWYAIYKYVPDIAGSYPGAFTCVTHGWATNPVD